MASELIQQLGINGSEISHIGSRSFPSPPGHPIQPVIPSKTGTAWYLKTVYDMGVIGPGKEIDTFPLPMGIWDSVEFAEKIGRICDTDTILRFPAWGYVDHWTMPNVEWAYGTLMDSRDINNHDVPIGPVVNMSCEEYVNLLASACLPFGDDPFMFDYSWKGDQAYKTGIYSEHKARFISWRQHYAMFYKESMLFCDWVFADLYNRNSKDGKGAAPSRSWAYPESLIY